MFRLRWLAFLGLAVLLVGLGFVTLTRPGRVAVKTVLLIPDVFVAFPYRPLAWLTEEPILETVEYPYDADGQAVVTDIYRPGRGGPRGTIIMSLGVNPIDRRDPILVRLSDGLARVGLVVLIHDSPELRAGRIVPKEIDGMVSAFNFARSQSYVDPARVGFVGFSIGGSLITVAAEDERIHRDVAFINTFGGFFDAFDFIRAITTHQQPVDGQMEPWQPHAMTVAVFSQHLVETVESPEQRAALARALAAIDGGEPADLDVLQPDTRALYDLFAGEDVQRVDELLAQLPPSTRTFLRAVSPSSGVRRLLARPFIMHDRGDHYVPYGESRRLVAALPDGTRGVYTEFSLFEHVTPTKPLDVFTLLQELGKLYYHLYLIMLEVA